MAKSKDVDGLRKAITQTRDTLFLASDNLRKQIVALGAHIESKLMVKGQVPGASVAQLLTAQGIAIDKMSVVLKQLRDLENESDHEYELGFVVIEESSDGTRRVVGGEPRLPALEIKKQRRKK